MGIIFVSEKKQLVDAVKLINKNTGEVAFFGLADGRITNDIGDCLIDCILLVVVQFLVGSQKSISLLNANLSHGTDLAQKRVVAGDFPPLQSAIP